MCLQGVHFAVSEPCVCRMMAHDMGISWSEYWDFLDCFTDLSTGDGLHKLEAYLQQLHESENELTSQNNALLQMEQGMDSLSLGHSPDGTLVHGARDPTRVLWCWGTPPGVRGSGDGGGKEREDGKQRDVNVDRIRNVMDTSGEVESETNVLSNGEVRSESMLLTNGGRSDKRESKVDGDGEHKSENTAATKGDSCVSSNSTVSVGGDEVRNESAVLVDDGRYVRTASRNVETDTSSSNNDTCHQSEPQKEPRDVSREEMTSGSNSDTPVDTQVDVNTTLSVTTTDTLAMTDSNETNQVTTCQSHGSGSKSCDQLPTAAGGSTISDQNATVVIDKDASRIVQVAMENTNIAHQTSQDVDTVQQGMMMPGGTTGTAGESSQEGHLNVDFSQGNESLDTTVNTTCVSRVCQNTTRAHDRGDGIDNDVLYDSLSTKVDAADGSILPCRTKSHNASNDKPVSSVSNLTSKETVKTNVVVTCIGTSASVVTDDTRVSSDGPSTEHTYKDTTRPKDSSVSDDACSVCSSVSSYHTVRDNVDFDYANLDDFFIPSRPQSPSRLPPVFILG